jgi:hypothetical protein
MVAVVMRARKEKTLRCPCEDSNGVVCGKRMTEKEIKQDGMCDDCACEVWHEMTSEKEYHWTHKPKD